MSQIIFPQVTCLNLLFYQYGDLNQLSGSKGLFRLDTQLSLVAK